MTQWNLGEVDGKQNTMPLEQSLSCLKISKLNDNSRKFEDLGFFDEIMKETPRSESQNKRLNKGIRW